MVDALVLGTSVERRAGSSPATGTNTINMNWDFYPAKLADNAVTDSKLAKSAKITLKGVIASTIKPYKPEPKVVRVVEDKETKLLIIYEME